MQTYMANPDKIERKWYVVDAEGCTPVSYTHLTLPTNSYTCRSRWSPYH